MARPLHRMARASESALVFAFPTLAHIFTQRSFPINVPTSTARPLATAGGGLLMALVATCSPCLFGPQSARAQHADVVPFTNGGVILTGAHDDLGDTTSQSMSVFGYDFGEDPLDPWIINDPGFNNSSAFTAGGFTNTSIRASGQGGADRRLRPPAPPMGSMRSGSRSRPGGSRPHRSTSSTTSA